MKLGRAIARRLSQTPPDQLTNFWLIPNMIGPLPMWPGTGNCNMNRYTTILAWRKAAATHAEGKMHV